MKTFLQGLIDLFFPHLCLACQQHPPMPHSAVCVHCDYEMAPTDFHLHALNPVMERFWGRVPLHHAAACFHFSKSSKLRHLIHQLKYKNRPEIGLELGRIYGYLLRESPFYQTVDMLLPVPLHPRKEYLRGYNQAAMLATGIAETMERPCVTRLLTRATFSESQTKKSRIERFRNVESVFQIHNRPALQGKHLLLVDDVITTGATLEACALQLLEIEGTKVSVVSIALAGL